ncbi:GNAT family N-acetyltransferase [Fodinicola feengrottensis]|uniref:GNAT family N-acetyltransferase n=1 Tax=Fodinicola feengrottensis TaxID=435914 RepID=A0ABN2I995_9ACTN
MDVRWSVKPVAWDDPVGVELRADQEAELLARYGQDTEPGAKPTAATISVFLVVSDAFTGEPVGCGALRDLDEEAVEIKRMYVVPKHRGRGAGRAVLAALEQTARSRGATVARLETGTEQPEAITLYERGGYDRIDAFGSYVDNPQSVCYERIL